MRFVNYLYQNKKNIGIQLSEVGNIVPVDLCLAKNTPNNVENIFDVIDYVSTVNIGELKERVKGLLHLSISIEDIKVLAPIEYPKRNIFCLGKNYIEHALEMKGKTTDAVVIPKKPIYFSKLCYPAIGQGDSITGHVGVSEQVDYEVELAVIIGIGGRNIPESEVQNHIFGYTIVNDISARDLQIDHIQWYRAKSLDGFCPMGPAIVHKSAINYPPSLKIKSFVNEEIRQDGITSDLIFNIDHIVSELSRGTTLVPGDIIITGTPSGVGMGFDPPKYLKSGDNITCEIEHIGKISNSFL